MIKSTASMEHPCCEIATCDSTQRAPQGTRCLTFGRILSPVTQPKTAFLSVILAFISAANATDIYLRDNTPEGVLIINKILPNVRGTHLTYSLLQTTASKYFTLNNRTGQLHSLRAIDRDRLCVESGLCCTTDLVNEPAGLRISSHNPCPSLPYGHRASACYFNLTVSVVFAQGQQPDIHEVTVVVCEENDHTPVFTPHSPQFPSSGTWQDIKNEGGLAARHPLYTINVSESVPVGHKIRLPLASDIDAPPFHVRHYELQSLGSNSSQVSKLRNSPFRLEPVWNNEHANIAHMDSSVYPGDESAGSIVALDLVLIEPLDRESIAEYHYRLLAIDGGSSPHTGTLLLKIHVQDANDHTPTFTQAVYETTVKESASSGTEILQVHAADADEGPNALILYGFSPFAADWNLMDPAFKPANRSGVINPSASKPHGTPSGGPSSKQDLLSLSPSYWFRLDSETGKIYLRRPLDYEVKRQHRFYVLAYNPVTHQAGTPISDDSGHQSRTATATVVINVRNIDDEPPSIVIDYATGGQNDYKEIRENGPAHYFVAFVTVSDPDVSGDVNSDSWTDSPVVTCQLDSHQDVYRLDRDRSSVSSIPTTVRYSLVTIDSLDRERSAEDHVKVACQDSGMPSKNATAVVKVIILDENDCDPEIRVMSTPPGFGGRMSFADAWPTQKIIQATEQQADAVPLLAAYLGEVPVFTVQLLENQPVGTIFARVRAVDKDAGANGYVTFELPKSPVLLNVSATKKVTSLSQRDRIELSSSAETFEYIRIDEIKGDLSTKRKVDREEGGYAIFDRLFAVVKATDHGATLQRSSYVLLVVVILDENDNPPTFIEPKMHFTIHENEPAPAIVGEIRVVDADLHPLGLFNHGRPSHYAQIGYHASTTQMIDQHILQLRIDHGHNRRDLPFVLYRTTDGRFFLNTTRTLDRESEEAFQFVLIATDTEPSHLRGGSTQPDRVPSSRGHTSTASVLVTVLDVNDNQPEIIFPNPATSNSTLHRVSYLEYAGYEVISINANDRDAGDLNGKFYFELLPDMKSTDLFTIDRTKGLVRTRRRLTKEDLGEYRLQVVVSDHGTPPLRTHLTLRFLVDQSEPHHPGENRVLNGGYYPVRSSVNGPPGSGQYDRQSLLYAYQRDYDPDSTKRTLHADILLIVIVAMIVPLLIVMFGLCFYLRYKRNLFGFLPNLCGVCLGDGSPTNSMGQPCKQKSSAYLKNNLDTEKRRINAISHSQSTYSGVMESLLDCTSRSHQPMRLDSIGMPPAPSPRSPLALAPHQQPMQFVGSDNGNAPLGAAYTTQARTLLNEGRFAGHFSPNLVGSGGFFPANLPLCRPSTSMAVNIPDVADQAESLLNHKLPQGHCGIDRNCQLTDGFYAASVPFNMYNLGGGAAFNPAIQQEPFGPQSPFAPCPELGFRPIPDDLHLYQHIASNQLGTLRAGRTSKTVDPESNEYQQDARNLETQPYLFAWRSDPSLNQGVDGWNTLSGSIFGHSTTDASKATEGHHGKLLQRSNSNKYASRAVDGSKTMGANYSTLNEPSSVVGSTAKQKRMSEKKPAREDVGSHVIGSEQYTVTFPKVQASFV